MSAVLTSSFKTLHVHSKQGVSRRNPSSGKKTPHTTIVVKLRDFRIEMNKPRWTSPFAPLLLSDDEKKKLRQLAQSILACNMEEYEEFIVYHDSKLVPEHDWKLLRRDSQVKTYVRRPGKYGLNGFGTKKRFRQEDDEPSSPARSSRSDKTTSLDVVDLRTIGITSGTKEDAVYGVMNPTTITMRIKSAYVDDGIQDCNVLNVIQNPTPEDPFSTLSVRWRVTENPPVFNWVIKSYDHVYIDATGVITLSSGEQVAYQLLHSIDFSKAIPKLPQYSRGHVAGIVFYRQVNDSLVSIWARGVFTVPTERVRALFEPVVGAAMSKSVINNFQAAQMKKLRWALHRRQKDLSEMHRETNVRSASSGRSHKPSARVHLDDRVCITCTKKPMLQKGNDCDLCDQLVCSSCFIKHKVAIVDSINVLRWLRVRVCSFCMAKVVKMDAVEAIGIEYAAGEYDRIN